MAELDAEDDEVVVDIDGREGLVTDIGVLVFVLWEERRGGWYGEAVEELEEVTGLGGCERGITGREGGVEGGEGGRFAAREWEEGGGGGSIVDVSGDAIVQHGMKELRGYARAEATGTDCVGRL
jgi:hypothetical protein